MSPASRIETKGQGAFSALDSAVERLALVTTSRLRGLFDISIGPARTERLD